MKGIKKPENVTSLNLRNNSFLIEGATVILRDYMPKFKNIESLHLGFGENPIQAIHF